MHTQYQASNSKFGPVVVVLISGRLTKNIQLLGLVGFISNSRAARERPRKNQVDGSGLHGQSHICYSKRSTARIMASWESFKHA